MIYENTPSIMMRSDFLIKIINISASFLVVGLVVLFDAEKLYPDYLKGTASGAILYLFLLSGYGVAVSKSLSLSLVKFYLHRVFYVWFFLSLLIFFISFSGIWFEYLNYWLILSSALVNGALVTPWVIHVLPKLSSVIVFSRIVFWVGISFSLFLENFWVLYILVSFFGGGQLFFSLSSCNFNNGKQQNLKSDVISNPDIWGFKLREIGSRLNENLANYLAASFFNPLNVIIFHMTMKLLSLGSSLLYIPVRARLRGFESLDYSQYRIVTYLIVWFSFIIGIWFIIFVFDNEVLSVFSNFNDASVIHQFFYFAMQPTSIIIVILVFLHVYMKAKKDILIWPNISIKLELFSILLSVTFLVSITSLGSNVNALILLGWHFLVLIQRDLFVLELYKRFETK